MTEAQKQARDVAVFYQTLLDKGVKPSYARSFTICWIDTGGLRGTDKECFEPDEEDEL